MIAGFMATPALAADKRVALVIGNSAYKNTAQLKNPANDATDIAAALRRLDFDVVNGLDLDYQGMRTAVRRFSEKLPDANVALLFYAGHGLQVAGKNYLVPVDAQIETQADLDFGTIDLDLVLRGMEADTRTNIIFLDACRDNPLAVNLTRRLGTRSGGVEPRPRAGRHQRRHADLVFDPARQRRARRRWPQQPVHLGAAQVDRGARPGARRGHDRRPQRRAARHRPQAGAVGQFIADRSVLFQAAAANRPPTRRRKASR